MSHRCDSTHHHACEQPQNHTHEHSFFDRFIKIAEKVSLIALGIFSAFISPQLFLPFFFIGVGIGIWSYFKKSKEEAHNHGASSCANGFLEQLAGVKLPPVISLIANLAVTICHIDHHSTVFVPVVAISVGSWVGESATKLGVYLYDKAKTSFNAHHSHEAPSLA